MKPPKFYLSKVSLLSPMSSANLSAGFDVLGVALDAYYDELDIELDDKPDEVVVNTNVNLPEENTAKRAAVLFKQKLQFKGKIEVYLKKGIPAGKGLGSSGSSASGVVYGLNLAFGAPLSENELVDIAARSELSPHADNVSASLLGGFAFVYSREPYSAFSIYRDWEFIIVIPDVETPQWKTESLRKKLGEPVSYDVYLAEKYAFNSILRGLIYDDKKSFGEGMSVESYHQIVRASTGLYSDYLRSKKELINAGALGVCISGAGPSFLVLPGDKMDESVVEGVLKEKQVEAKVVKAKVSKGIKVIGKEV